MIILTLDIATQTGWALYNPSNKTKITSGTESFHIKSQIQSTDMVWRKFERFLKDIKAQNEEINSIYFEHVQFVGKNAGDSWRFLYGGFISSLTRFCDHHNILYEGIGVGKIKKFITGKGNAGKDKIIGSVRGLGHDPKDDNEADALALLYYAFNEEGITCT